tara:strand:+ start:5189 stop:5347 length:159 start_codon:yes stop_codon:yes gene_type:complete
MGNNAEISKVFHSKKLVREIKAFERILNVNISQFDLVLKKMEGYICRPFKLA